MAEEKQLQATVAAGAGYDDLEIYGAREHNLKNFDLRIPRNALVVITGISGSGKSSLAFDTIYAEGQRRYMESFSAYARSFIGGMERPDVDKINGLSPVISIEQKTTARNPRSTVGTTTEIYDFLRLLFARAGIAYSYETGNKMEKQTTAQVVKTIMEDFDQKKLIVLAPLVRGRKGHYRELFERLRKSGYTKVRVDGNIEEIKPKMQVDRYKVHDIELVVDRLVVHADSKNRLSQAVDTAMKWGDDLMAALQPDEAKPRFFSKALMDAESGLSYSEPSPNTFSFNSPYGACPRCNGMGIIQEIREEDIIPDTSKSISRGGIIPLGSYRDIFIFRKIEALLKEYNISLGTPIKKIPEEVMQEVLYGSELSLAVKSNYSKKPYMTSFEGVIHHMEHLKEEGSAKIQRWVNEFTTTTTCPKCEGGRLRKESLHFKMADKNISELAQMDLQELQNWLSNVEEKLTDKQIKIGGEVLKEIRKRLGFLLDVGLYYLTLDRPVKTLSGGEAQRIRLATQIGTQLVGVLYILDEPSIGLHQRDNAKLIHALKELRDLGNSIMVVEHDRDMMLSSDYIVDIGPGAGVHGGKVVAQGAPNELLKAESATGQYLAGIQDVEIPEKRREGTGESIVLKGAKGHNLKDVDFELPLGKMVCVTGVSGSGKSTLIHETLFPIIHHEVYQSHRKPLQYESIDGLQHIDKIIEVDQSPIGRTPRSNPATYTGVFTDIRKLFSELPESKIRGYKPGRFSFNVKGGRCETCKGGGKKLIEMEFLPDVLVECESCRGKRYNRETLEVRFKGKSIADVLEMTVEDAVAFFDKQPRIKRKIQTLYDVGLGYITLGQHATTLSGGEAQRVKLATELSKKDTGQTLYVLDEPTTGLHFQDIQHLLHVLGKLVDKGNTLLVIEHNMDVIKACDWLIDLGPEGGAQGGQIVAQGSPEDLAQTDTYTGRFLRPELERSLA